MAQLVKNPPAMQEIWVWSLGWEDPLEKGKATHSSILAWRIPWSMGSQRVGRNWAHFTFFPTCLVPSLPSILTILRNLFKETKLIRNWRETPSPKIQIWKQRNAKVYWTSSSHLSKLGSFPDTQRPGSYSYTLTSWETGRNYLIPEWVLLLNFSENSSLGPTLVGLRDRALLLYYKITLTMQKKKIVCFKRRHKIEGKSWEILFE